MITVKSIVKQRFEDSVSKANDQTFVNDALKILEFILDAGKEYEVEGAQDIPALNFRRQPFLCYSNSKKFVRRTEGDSLYCEGWATLETLVRQRDPKFHAWNVLHGKVIDTTWNHLPGAKYYFGLIIPLEFVSSRSSAPLPSCLPAWIERNTSVTERRVEIIFDLLF